jgi:hypothetical protein
VVKASAERTVQSVQTVVKEDTATVAMAQESEAKEERKPRAFGRWLLALGCLLLALLMMRTLPLTPPRGGE